MSQKNTKPHNQNATLDALLKRGVLADHRANKPVVGPASALPPQSSPAQPRVTAETHRLVTPQDDLRLTVRFTEAEAVLLEKARGLARSMGYKISDTIVFRLALNTLRQDQITPVAIESMLKADARRRISKRNNQIQTTR